MERLRPRSASTLSRASASVRDSSPDHKPTPIPLLPSSNQSQPGNLPPDCPLSDPSLGIISLNDHRTRKCLCKFCTCGLHKCPSEAFLSPYPKSMFISQYQRQYMGTNAGKQVAVVKRKHRENVNPMEMLSAYERDFRPFRVETMEAHFTTSEPKAKPRPQSAGPRPRLAGTTTNQLQYPNWGESHPYHVKRFYEQVPTRDASFQGRSEYGERYQSFGGLKNVAATSTGANDHSSLALHGSEIKLSNRTTAKAEFREIAGVHRSESCKREHRIPAAVMVPDMYVTEYNHKFTPQTPLVKNPQDVRKMLSAREQ